MSEHLTLFNPQLYNYEPLDPVSDLQWEEKAEPIVEPYNRFDQWPTDLSGEGHPASLEDRDEAYNRALQMADLAIELMINGDGRPATSYLGEGTKETWYVHAMAKQIIGIKLQASRAQSMALAASETKGSTAAG